MTRYDYYQKLKHLARSIRNKYNLDSPRVLPSKIKQILKSEGVDYIDLSKNLKKARGVYINDEYGVTVLIKKNLPQDPYAFTLAHELKHHLVDAESGSVLCTDGNISEEIEIGAEIFAAELLFPESMFCESLDKVIGQNRCEPKHIVILKKQTNTTLSYHGLSKRAIFNNYLNQSEIKGIKWKKLEEEIYGLPFYKRKFKK